MVADRVWLEQWRRIAELRGFRQDGGGWKSPAGHRVSAEFVRRMCTPVDDPRREVDERHDDIAAGAA